MFISPHFGCLSDSECLGSFLASQPLPTLYLALSWFSTFIPTVFPLSHFGNYQELRGQPEDDSLGSEVPSC